VGGARLLEGLYHALGPGELTAVVNGGDDFEHLGLRICPDLDTVLYTLAGLADPERGWGRRDETWSFMETLGQLGGPAWFRLGDRDLALHAERTRRLAGGERLTPIMADIGARLGVRATLLPMSDALVPTIVETDAGDLPFQEYFVARRCEPAIRRLRYMGASSAAPPPEFFRALASDRLEAIIICPSNPFLSIAPILAVGGLRAALRAAAVPVIAVSPLIQGKAVKGPAARIMADFDVPPTPAGVAGTYAGLIDTLVIDDADIGAAQPGDGIRTFHCPTLMPGRAERLRLASFVLDCIARIGSPGPRP